MGGQTHKIGDWTFDAAANELRRGDDRRHLEDRTARTLELLCARRGEPVARDDIVEAVWNGRSQSANSVSVVIGDLRRALDDSARQPRYIETVAKRGYRLVAPAAAAPDKLAGRHWRGASVFVLLGILVALWLSSLPRHDAVQVIAVANATGDPSYDPLARATTELIVTTLARHGVAVSRGEADLRMESKLILWNGEPTVALTALDDSGRVRWSAMARGPAADIAPNVMRSLEDFTAAHVD